MSKLTCQPSCGVRRCPRNTKSRRKLIAFTSPMLVESNSKIKRWRTSASWAALSRRSVSFSGSPGKKICVTKRFIQLGARIENRVRAGLDGEKLEPAVGVGHQSSLSREVGIDRRIGAIHLVNVPSRGIRLPHFDHRIYKRRAVFVGDAPENANKLTHSLRSAGSDPRKIQMPGIQPASEAGGTGPLRQGQRTLNQRSGRVASEAEGVLVDLAGELRGIVEG